MSLNELNEFLGSIGASVRTGPIHGSHSSSSSKVKCRHCSNMKSCSCNSNPIVTRMHIINQELPSMRERKLYDLLRLQSGLLGLIISRSTGKCIGAINNRGSIVHCDAQEAKGPYNIMIKPTSQDRIPQGCPPAARPIGQCVNEKGKTVAEISRKHGKNSLNLADKSKAPVIAVVLPMVQAKGVQGAGSQAASSAPEPSSSIDDMIRESKSLVLNHEN